eukprot:6204327-Pleurochrysis_carterae.AAC.1
MTKAIRTLEGLGVSNRGAGVGELSTYGSSPLYTGNAKPLKDPSILRTECELRQQGARRRDGDLGADCLERRSGNQLRDGAGAIGSRDEQ